MPLNLRFILKKLYMHVCIYPSSIYYIYIYIYIDTAKSVLLCPTLYDPIDGSPPDSPVPGILQARTLEWVAISSSNAWKWKVKVKSLSHVWLFVTPWTAAYQAPPSMGFTRWVLEWGAFAFSIYIYIYIYIYMYKMKIFNFEDFNLILLMNF